MDDNKRKEVYANAMTLNNTFFDFAFSFKKENFYETEDGQKKEVEEVAFVHMSPQMAKAMCNLLHKNIDKYEEEYGTIPEFGKK